MINKLDDLKTWFDAQGDRTAWVLYRGDKVPNSDDKGSNTIAAQRDPEMCRRASFDILERQISILTYPYLTVKVNKGDRDSQGGCMTYKYQGAQQGLPQLGYTPAPAVQEKTEVFERLFAMQNEHSARQMESSIQILELRNQLQREKEQRTYDKKYSVGALEKLANNEHVVNAILSIASTYLNPTAKVAGGLHRLDTQTPDDNPPQMELPDMNALILQHHELSKMKLNANQVLNEVIELASIATANGIVAKTLLPNLIEKVQNNPSLLKML